jgi:hypothetical protein
MSVTFKLGGAKNPIAPTPSRDCVGVTVTGPSRKQHGTTCPINRLYMRSDENRSQSRYVSRSCCRWLRVRASPSSFRLFLFSSFRPKNPIKQRPRHAFGLVSRVRCNDLCTAGGFDRVTPPNGWTVSFSSQTPLSFDLSRRPCHRSHCPADVSPVTSGARRGGGLRSCTPPPRNFLRCLS